MYFLLFGLLWPIDTPVNDTAQKAIALVAQLGDPSFRRREAAAKELIALGAASRIPLQAGLQSGDAEIRARCKVLLPAAWEADFRYRLDRLRNDTAGKLTHDLPGWPRMGKYGGNTPEVRALYTDIIAAQKEGVKYLELQPSALIEHYEERLAAIHARELEWVGMMRQGSQMTDLRLETDELNFWLLAFADERLRADKTTPETTQKSYLKNLLKEAGTYKHSKDAVKKALLASTLSTVLISLMSEVDRDQYIATIFDIAESRELTGCANVAAELLSAKFDNMNAIERSIGFLGLYGQERHLKSLENYLNDTRELSNGYFQGYTTQYRDFALAMMLRIQGQNPRNFGFALATKEGMPKAYSFGFKSDADRAKAFAMYGDYLNR